MHWRRPSSERRSRLGLSHRLRDKVYRNRLMSTGRFILRYRGGGSIPEEDLARIRSLSDIKIIDASPRMLLIEAPDKELRSAVSSMPQWILTEERLTSIPDPRPKLINK